ncbi:STE3-domain-containing protein [Hymenopellis radicata]|nr:STE3-domain-containing protein [Hymenopellis radicata]
MGFPPNHLFSAFAFIGFVMCMIPLRWHLQAYNVGTCAYMIWVGLGCLNLFINSIIWNGNAIDSAPVFCDISFRLTLAMDVAIPICSLVINRRLFFIATSDTVVSSRKDRQRAIMMDLALVIGAPIALIILAYIPQGNRYNIYEDWGCFPSIYNTWVSVMITNVPPIAIGLVSATYCVRTIIAFNKRRRQFQEVLSSHSNLSSNRYFRLMIMAGADILFTVPLGVWVLILNVSYVHPWISWENVHADFMNVYQYPALYWQSSDNAFGVELQRWLTVFGAWVFFFIFGIHAESRRNYRTALNSFAHKLGASTTLFGGSLQDTMGSRFGSTKDGSIPVFEKRRVQKRDSLESFTDMSMSMSQTSDMKKSFAGDTSFGAFSFADIGGALEEKEAEAVSPHLHPPHPPLPIHPKYHTPSRVGRRRTLTLRYPRFTACRW